MAVKIRLQRHGKKGNPIYWIVIADEKSKRDGKYIEKLGTYDPNTNPASIELDFDSSVKWLEKGAQPTNTAKAILSYEGVLLRKHLNLGVQKGAFTEEEAKKRFDEWKKGKGAKIEKKIEDLESTLESNKKEARKREEEYSKKRSEESKAKEEAKAEEAKAAEETAPAEEETPAEEEAPDEKAKAAEETAPEEEAKAEEAPDEKAKAAEETAPAEEEVPAEEAPDEKAKAAEETAPAEEGSDEATPAEEK
ncbi:MAG TPA: 30S ribosomal protein S16 [Flavobacteriaceae bacterium]|jgi:small subunit ribosomal protein S16|nr:30S ribosomal protein S16 [Flavobacteriaceae bacterium]